METNGRFGSCNSCKRPGHSRLLSYMSLFHLFECSCRQASEWRIVAYDIKLRLKYDNPCNNFDHRITSNLNRISANQIASYRIRESRCRSIVVQVIILISLLSHLF